LAFHRWSANATLSSSKFRNSFFLLDLQRYFCGKIVPEQKLDDKQQYIFGFHPHGTLTSTALWCHHSPDWKANVLQNDLVTLVGSQLLYLPVCRELILAAGGRAVSAKSFSKALEEGSSVLLIPGGLAEMKYSSSTDKDITVVTSHKGFIRFAIRYGVNLVPVFSFGETKVLDPWLPSMQRLFHRFFGIPFPLWCGRFIQVPRSCGVTVVVGTPISVDKNDNPSQEDIDKVHRQYFEALYGLFEKHKNQCRHQEHNLRLKDFPYELPKVNS